jgi:hypothetical protein
VTPVQKYTGSQGSKILRKILSFQQKYYQSPGLDPLAWKESWGGKEKLFQRWKSWAFENPMFRGCTGRLRSLQLQTLRAKGLLLQAEEPEIYGSKHLWMPCNFFKASMTYSKQPVLT